MSSWTAQESCRSADCKFRGGQPWCSLRDSLLFYLDTLLTSLVMHKKKTGRSCRDGQIKQNQEDLAAQGVATAVALIEMLFFQAHTTQVVV